MAEDANKFTAGMTFSAEGLEAAGKYELWSPAHKFEYPLDMFVPGLSARFSPDVSVVGAVGSSKKKEKPKKEAPKKGEEKKGAESAKPAGPPPSHKGEQEQGEHEEEEELSVKLGLEGGVQLDLAYGVPDIAQMYFGGTMTLSDGFEFTKKGHDWTLEGGIGLSTALVCGVNIGNDIVGHIDYSLQLVGTDIGKLTSLKWHNGKMEGKPGWEWSENMKTFFASVRRIVDKAMHIAKMGVDAAKAAYKGIKTGAKAVYTAGSDVVSWLSSW